jgi:hypothetical protein
MSGRIRGAKLGLILGVLLAGTALWAERVHNGFDSPDEAAALNSKNVFWEQDETVAGAGAIRFADKTIADYDGQGLNCSFTIPKGTPEGVLTFWIYDPLFEIRRDDSRFNLNLGFHLKEGSQSKWSGYQFLDFRTRGRWLFGTGLFDMQATSAMRHPGWTRFDIINPPGDEPQPFRVCVDGREVAKTKPLSSIDRFSISAGTGFFYAPVLIDEVSYDTDSSTYRPNVVQEIVCGGEPRSVELGPGENLTVGLGLAPGGARQQKGELTLRLLDGMEKPVLQKVVKLDWRKQAGGVLNVDLPSPPRSGYYWLEASYLEKDGKLADVARSRVDVQFLAPRFKSPQHASITINTPWDFVPIDDEIPHKHHRINTLPEIPQTAPTDWSGATPLIGPWYCWGGETFRCSSTGVASWYRQVLEIPADWRGRRILLDIDDPKTVAYVFVNGVRLGMVENPGGRVEVTSQAVAGGKLDVALFVVATGIYGKTKVTQEILGERYQVPPWASRQKKRGLVGDVCLVSEPMATRLESVVVRTYVEQKKLWLGFDCAELTPGKRYTIESAVSTAGDTVKAVPAQSFTATAKTQRIEVAVPWENPRLWDIGHPFLYDLNASLLDENNQAIDTVEPVRFGFREVLFKDRLVTINGQPINFFHPLTGGYAINNFGYRDYMSRAGFNGLQKIDTITARHARFFDEAGLGLRYKAGDGFSQHYIPVLAKYGKEKDPRFWAAYQKDIEYLVKKHLNNPSVLFWRGEKFSNITGLEMNPLLQDGIWKRKAENEQEERMMEVAVRTGNIIRALDPTRYQSAMCSHAFNDSIDVNYYTGFNPIQELIERNEYWKANGKKPYFVDEYASPFHTDWSNSPWEGGGGHTSPRKVPQIAEWLAVTKGDGAFVRGELETAALKAFEKQSLGDLDKAAKIKDPQKRKVAVGKRAIRGFGKVCALYKYNAGNRANQLVQERLREQVYNWRADGVAMMCYFGGGQLRELGASQVYQPVAAFIAGTPEKRTAKDHIFAPGETLRRSVLILNNERVPVTVRCQWRLTLAGKEIAGSNERISIPGGGQVSVPIQVQIPSGGDREGTLEMTLTAAQDDTRGTLNFRKNQTIAQDSCPIQIIAPRTFPNRVGIAVIDPEGESATSLAKAGVRFDRVHFNSDLQAYDTIIFGRRAFGYEMNILEEGIDLGALTAQGKTIVILEQSEEVLRNRFQFRTEYTSSRYAYSRHGGGSLFDGLSDGCLNYWRGASTLTDGYVKARESLQPGPGYRGGAYFPYTGNDGKEKKRIMKWGNTHNVVTVLIVKPDTGNFRTLADCGFSLNYAGALELLSGNGRVIFNQLDVSGRTEEDPAARRFLANLVDYASSAPKPLWRRVAYLGDDQGAEMLSFLRIDFKRLQTPAESAPGQVLVLGQADAKTLMSWKDGIRDFAKAGGRVFCLPQAAEAYASGFLPFKVKAAPKAVSYSVVGKTSDPLLAGLGNSDFYWKGEIELVALEEVEGATQKLDSGVLARVPHGQGEYVFCQIVPGMFDVDKRFWLTNSQRQTERLMVNLLSNLGAEMSTPYFMSAVGAKTELADSIALAGPWSVCPAQATDLKCPAKSAGGWQAVTLPGSFQQQVPGLAKRQGFVWFRREFKLKDQAKDAAFVELEIGQINGADRTYINGEIVGEINMNTHVNDARVAFRKYKVPANLLKSGTNQISIRVEFNADALLGMANTNGEISPPLTLKIYANKADLASNLEPVNLEGKWLGNAVGQAATPCPAPNDTNWHSLVVPAAYEKQHPSWQIYNGYFWYRKTFKLKSAVPSGAEPFLLLGGVDDWDTTYLNGKEIGHTTPQNFFKLASAYNTPRKYPIPTELLKAGDNEITMLVHDPQFDGGITFAPVKLVFADPRKVQLAELLKKSYLQLASDDIEPYVARHW